MTKLEHCRTCHAWIPENKPGEHLPCPNCMAAMAQGCGANLGKPCGPACFQTDMPKEFEKLFQKNKWSLLA